MQTKKTNRSKHRPAVVEFSKRLQYVANDKKITQTDLGAITGINKSSISLWWNGIVKPGMKNMHILAAALGCDTDWLNTGKGEPFSGGSIVKVTAVMDRRGKERTPLKSANQNKATRIQSHLKVLVDWMDEYFTENPDESVLFYEEVKDNYPSFKDFVEKKIGRTNSSNRHIEKKSVNSE